MKGTLELASAFLFFFLLVALAYWRAIRMDFIGDDLLRVVANLQSLDDGIIASISAIMPDRPLLGADLWLNHLLPGGLGHVLHLGNLVWQAIATVALVHLVSVVLAARARTERLVIVLLAAVFAIHPANSQAVTTVIQRGVMISAAFSMLSLATFVAALREGLPRRSILLSSFWFFLAVLAKPNVATVPLMMLAAALLLENRASPKRVAIAVLAPCCAFAVPVVFYLLLGVNHQSTAPSAYLYFLTQLKAWLIYLRVWFWPRELRFIWNIPLASGLTDKSVLMALGAQLAIALVLLRVSKGDRPARFFLFCGYLALIPESGFFPINHPVFEHRAYFPAAMAFAFIAALLLSQAREAAPAKIRSVVAIAITAWLALSVPLIVFAHERMSEIDTNLKWAANTIARTHADHSSGFATKSNISVLGDLIWASRVEWYEGIETLCAELARQYPEVPEYSYYRDAFHYSLQAQAKKPLADRREDDVLADSRNSELDDLARSIFGKKFIVPSTPVVAVGFLYNAFHARYSNLESDKRFEMLAFAVMPVALRAEAGRTVHFLQLYGRVLHSLASYYSRRYSQGFPLSIDEKAQWLRVEAALWVYFSENVVSASGIPLDILRGKAAHLRHVAPERKDLIFLDGWLRKPNPLGP